MTEEEFTKLQLQAKQILAQYKKDNKEDKRSKAELEKFLNFDEEEFKIEPATAHLFFPTGPPLSDLSHKRLLDIGRTAQLKKFIYKNLPRDVKLLCKITDDNPDYETQFIRFEVFIMMIWEQLDGTKYDTRQVEDLRKAFKKLISDQKTFFTAEDVEGKPFVLLFQLASGMGHICGEKAEAEIEVVTKCGANQIAAP